MDALGRTERRRTLAAGALLTLLALDVVFGFLASRLLSDVGVPQERWQASASDRALIDALAISFAVLSIGTLAVWMTWQYAAHESLWQRSVPGLRHKPNVVGWWLVPIIGMFTAGMAVGEIVNAVPTPRGFTRVVLRVLFGVWWFVAFVFTATSGGIWDTGGPIAVRFSPKIATTFALVALVAFPLVWLLDRGVGKVLPWQEPAPERRDVLAG